MYHKHGLCGHSFVPWLRFNFTHFSAKIVVELAKYAYVQATVLLHPSFVSWQDVQGVYSITEPFPSIIFLMSFRSFGYEVGLNIL